MKKLKVKRIIVHAKNARIKQDPGDGFIRLEYPSETVPSNSARYVQLNTFRNTIMVSAGWRQKGSSNPICDRDTLQ